MKITIEQLIKKFPTKIILLYDNKCNLCLFWKRSVESRDIRNIFQFENIHLMVRFFKLCAQIFLGF